MGLSLWLLILLVNDGGVSRWGIPEVAPLQMVDSPRAASPSRRKLWATMAGALLRRSRPSGGGGGVLEHPEGSHAWRAFGIPSPPRSGGWISDGVGGWTCCVSRGNYGHPARKLTWLYLFGVVGPPSLEWSHPIRRLPGVDTASHELRRRLIRTGVVQRLSHRQRAATPIVFRDLLLSLARLAFI